MASTTISGYKQTVAEFIEFIRGEDVTNPSRLAIRAYLVARGRAHAAGIAPCAYV